MLSQVGRQRASPLPHQKWGRAWSLTVQGRQRFNLRSTNPIALTLRTAPIRLIRATVRTIPVHTVDRKRPVGKGAR